MRTLGLAALLAASLLSGCLSESPAPEETPPPTQEAPAPPANLTAPAVDARATLDMLREFSLTFPYRQSDGPTHNLARDWLETTLEGAGLEVLRQPFTSSVTGFLPVAEYEGQNIIGIHWGADREHWIVVGAHYDTTEGAVGGAYDDGSGTILTVRLAQAFSGINTTRTVAFVLFDQEERGLVGSNAFVASVVDGSFPLNVTLDGMIDLDMVGITHPHPAPLTVWQNNETLKAWHEELRTAAGVPDDRIDYREPSLGTSDGAVFTDAGVPTIYLWSDWDNWVLATGQAVPGFYPFWHQADTYETMVAMAGDEATLEAGFQTTLDILSPLLARMATDPALAG